MSKFNPMLITLALGTTLLLAATDASARDNRSMWSVADAMATSDAQAQLTGDIQFHFGDGNHPAVDRTIGNWMSNKKTNAFNKSDEAACQRAFLSAMISLQQRAQREGGDAVVNIVSYYKKNRVSSETEFECGAGNVVAGVTLRGDVVRLK